jgi:hypothetical protein
MSLRYDLRGSGCDLVPIYSRARPSDKPSSLGCSLTPFSRGPDELELLGDYSWVARWPTEASAGCLGDGDAGVDR